MMLNNYSDMVVMVTIKMMGLMMMLVMMMMLTNDYDQNDVDG